jgi:hypothetical protein
MAAGWLLAGPLPLRQFDRTFALLTYGQLAWRRLS